MCTPNRELGNSLPTELHALAQRIGLGLVESEPITDDVRTLLLEWLRGPGKRYRRELGWLLNRKFRGQRLQGTVPQRKFIGITKRTRDYVRRAVGAEIAEA